MLLAALEFPAVSVASDLNEIVHFSAGYESGDTVQAVSGQEQLWSNQDQTLTAIHPFTLMSG
jgi:hypothetical protein